MRPLWTISAFALLLVWPALGEFAPARSDVGGTPAEKKVPDTFFRLGHLEERLFADAADGRLDEHSLLGATLIASGVQRAETLRQYEAQLSALVAQLRRRATPADPPRRRAERVFDFMHDRILRGGYRVESTDLRLTLDQGRYNCVSASVLFNCLAGEFGLAPCGLEIPGHAMSRLRLPDGPLDVETTCPEWFRFIYDPKRQAELLEEATGLRPGDNRGQVREISPVQLTAMIYYNRGIELLAEKRFAEAAAANAKAVRLDPSSSTAWGNLLATLNNWAVALGETRHHAEAAHLLRSGLALEPGYQAFALNYVHVHHQWVEYLCGLGRFGEALDVLSRAGAERPDQPYFRRASLEVYGRWAGTRFAAGRPDRGLAAFGDPHP